MNQKLLSLVTAMGLTVAFGLSISASLLQSRAAEPLENRDRGKEVYNTYCVGCHGALGDGKGPAAYAFQVAPRNFVGDNDPLTTSDVYVYGIPAGAQVPTDQALHETVAYGRNNGAMPAFPLLTTAERDAVITYIKSFRAGGWPDVSAVPVAVAPVADEAVLAFIETVKALPETEKLSISTRAIKNIMDNLVQPCSTCHIINAMGYATGPIGPNLTGIGTAGRSEVTYDYLVESLVNPAAVIAGGCPNGPCTAAMPTTYSQVLTPAQVDAIARWLLSDQNK